MQVVSNDDDKSITTIARRPINKKIDGNGIPAGTPAGNIKEMLGREITGRMSRGQPMIPVRLLQPNYF